MAQTMDTQELSTADLANAAKGRENQDVVRSEAERHTTGDQSTGPLLPEEFCGDMRIRWVRIQTAFVDDPRISVQEADELVAMAIKKLAESFAEERANLERQWSQGNDVSTEDLRQALRRYRAFFQRLLSI